MRKLAVALSKGGVGKTATASNLAHGLARAGYRVLALDLDTQGQLGRAFGVQPPAGLAEVVAEELTPEQAMIQAREGLWLLAGGRALAGLKRMIDRKDIGSELALVEALAPIDGQFDFVIMDLAPSWDVLTVCSLMYAQEVLSPVSLEAASVQGLIGFVKSLAPLQRYNQSLILKYVLPTFYDRRVRKSDEILEQLQGHYSQQICSPIRYSVRISEAFGFGQSVFEYAPGSPGAQDYQKLVERIAQNGRS